MAADPRSFADPSTDTSPHDDLTPPENEGLFAQVDVHRLGEDDPELDWEAPADGPADEVAYGANHANRAHRAEGVQGQGGRTRARNRDIVKGHLYR